MSNSPLSHFLEPQVARALNALRAKPDVYLIALVGIPGSGKSTFSKALALRLPGSVVVPIIVEGNYLLLQAWGLEDLFDFKIFLNCDINLAMDRV